MTILHTIIRMRRKLTHKPNFVRIEPILVVWPLFSALLSEPGVYRPFSILFQLTIGEVNRCGIRF